MFNSADELVASFDKVSTLPAIYYRLDEAINDPYADLSQIADILMEDTALSARLLRLANSAMFNFPSKVETISHAITIIGTRQLRDLAFATSVIKMFSHLPSESISMESFWRHSIATGIAARVIATYRRESNVERFYVMGLLHDIGRLLMFLGIPREMSGALMYSAEKKVPLFQAELEVLNFDHTQVGRALLQQWQIPVSLREGVGCHHTPAGASRYPEEASTVHIADLIANAFKMGGSGALSVPPFVEHAWDILKLTENQLPLIVEQLEVQYESAVDIFLN